MRELNVVIIPWTAVKCGMMPFKIYVIFAYVAAVVSTALADTDPCLSSIHRNITHLNERYANLKDDCPYTDHRIEKEWFYAGADPITTFPPDYCSCGYKFPIWMNGTLPSVEDGIVDRDVCLKFIDQCHEKLPIKIKNCGSFFIYHLTPGPDDSGYCFGIDKPKPPQTTGENVDQTPNVTLTIQQNSVTSHSFITVINITTGGELVNVTAELLLSNGSVSQILNVDLSRTIYKWEHLSSATNYTVLIIYTANNGERLVLASSWTVTQIPYRPATAQIDIHSAVITKHSLEINITFDHGSENITANGTLFLQNGSVVSIFAVDKPSQLKRFQGLTVGTKYIVEVHTYRNGERTELGRKWIRTQPGIEAYLESLSVGDAKAQSTSFRCKFNPLPEVVYLVRWMVQRAERNYTIDKIMDNKHSINGLSLREEDLVKNHISLPFHVSCAVSANTDSPRSFSDSLFAGIKILTPVINMHRDETASIRFSPTVPFSCISSQDTKDCNLTIAISIPVSKNCTGISTRKCSVSVSGVAGVQHEIQIQATEDGQYGIIEEKMYKVFLRTANRKNDSIWNNYILPAVMVKVQPETEIYWRGKRCEALNDPHMYTFDGVHYEHHERFSDEYVLYTHTSYHVKIHHKLERCNWNAMCNCGVAVQAGRDIYLISTCNNVMEIGYKQCDDGVLLVKQESDSAYTIYLPFGTYIKTRLDKSPYFKSVGSMIVSVSVYPSVHDQHGRSRGLCGSLDNNHTNDFHERMGTIVLNRTEFIQKWSVSKEDSLFKTNAKSTAAWMHPACTCSVSSGHVTTKDKCRLGADNSCAKGRTVGKQTCKLAERISIESTEKHTVPVLDLSKDGNHKVGVTTQKGPGVTYTTQTTKSEVHVSQTPSSTPTEHWNRIKAKTFCSNYMNSSRAFRLCARVPYTDTGRAIDTCTQDIVITQTTEWHKLSRQSMQDSCISEIHRNKTVRNDLERPKQTFSTTTTSSGQHVGHVTTLHPDNEFKDANLDIIQIVDAIEEIACPNECSEKGSCKNGTCKCDVGFGGDDCSIDFKKPPSTASLLHGNTCDEKVAKCTHVFIYGGFFASETVSCHITTFETRANKEGRQNLDAYVIPGQAQSLVEVICSLTSPIRRKRSLPDYKEVKLLSCYRVSVSNDGIHHGKPLDMCVYNSECQTLSNNSNGIITANIKEGFCFIDGVCVPTQMQKPSAESYCLPEISLYSWSALPTSTETPSATTSVFVTRLVENTSSWKTPVIIAVVCTLTICIIAGLVVCMRKRKRRKTADKKKDKEELAVNYKHDADFDEETYAHINPIDVSDRIPYDKTLKLTVGVADDYSRLDIAKREKVDYAKLNATERVGRGDGPDLPARPDASYRDSYEKLRSTNQNPRVYDKIQSENRYQHTVPNITLSDPYSSLNKGTRKGNDYLELNKVEEDYLTPAKQTGNVQRETPRHLLVERRREDEMIEGYERPDPHYKRY